MRTDIDGGYLTPGTAYFVRVSARNAVGLGPSQDASPVEFATGNAIAPQAPPGLPTQVKQTDTTARPRPLYCANSDVALPPFF